MYAAQTEPAAAVRSAEHRPCTRTVYPCSAEMDVFPHLASVAGTNVAVAKLRAVLLHYMPCPFARLECFRYGVFVN